MSKAVQWMINIAVGVFFFFFFLFLFFPIDRVVQNFLAQVETQTKGQYRITASEIDASILFKSTFKNFKIYQNDVVLVEFSKLKLGMSYLPLLNNVVQASFVAKNGKSKIDGYLVISEKDFEIEIDFDKFDLDVIRYLEDGLKLPLKGQISGPVEIKAPLQKISGASGKIDLKLTRMALLETEINLGPGLGLELPDISLATDKKGAFKADINKGKMVVKDFSIPGPDMGLNLDGRIQIRDKIQLSRLDLRGSFFVSEKVEEAFPFMMFIEKQKNENGSFPLTLSGRFSQPRPKIGTFDLSSFGK